jgi:phage-related protein
MRELIFTGITRADLLEFPDEARRDAGYAFWLAQDGRKHKDAVPMKGFGGASVLEIRLDEDGDAYRAVYTVAFADAVYVLHCFQKKSRSGIATAQSDIELIKKRYKEARTISDARREGR